MWISTFMWLTNYFQKQKDFEAATNKRHKEDIEQLIKKLQDQHNKNTNELEEQHTQSKMNLEETIPKKTRWRHKGVRGKIKWNQKWGNC